MKVQMKRIKGQKGMSLVAVMIAMGILSLLTITMMEMLTLGARAQQGLNIQSSIRNFFDHVRAVSTTETSCSAALSGAPASGLFTLKDPDFSSRIVAQPGQSTDQWTVQTVQLTQTEAVPGYLNLFRATLNVRIQLIQPTLGVPFVVDRDVLVLYVSIVNGMVTHCYGVTNWLAESKAHCQAQGGAWSESPAPLCSNSSNNVSQAVGTGTGSGSGSENSSDSNQNNQNGKS